MYVCMYASWFLKTVNLVYWEEFSGMYIVVVQFAFHYHDQSCVTAFVLLSRRINQYSLIEQSRYIQLIHSILIVKVY